MASVLCLFAATATLLTPTWAQASTCNPTQGKCNPDPALSKAIFYDFTKGSSSDWTPSTGVFPSYNTSGAIFSIAAPLDSPTLYSNWYMMYGHYDIVTQIAPGQGAVSSSVLMSDDKDEIDLEWVGSQTNGLQCNYFGKGQEGSEQTVSVSSPDTTYHTYSIDWTASTLTWLVDGQVVRSIPSSSPNYPQTPMKLQLGTWPGGDPHEPAGTQAWAGGPINYNDVPFTMIVKSVTAYDYSTGTNYTYMDTSGSASKISSTGGKIAQYSNTNGMTVTTAVMGTASSSTSSAPATLSPSSVTSSSTPASSSASSSSAAVATTSASSSSAAATTSAASSVSASVASSSTPAQAPVPSTFSTVASSSAPNPTGSGSGSGNGSGRGSGSGSGWGNGSGRGSGSGSGNGRGSGNGASSGSGTGTSGIPAPVQSGINAIGAKNPMLGSWLEGFWQWLEQSIQGHGRR